MKQFLILIISIWFLFSVGFGTENGDSNSNRIAIKASKIVTVSGNTIENGVILVNGEKIEKVGTGIPIPDGYTVFEYKDGIVYPGIINPYTNVGISGTSPVQQANDDMETGLYNPDISTFTAYYSWSHLIPITREFGTLITFVAPYGSLIVGKGVLVSLDGWTPDDMFIKKEAALVIQYPSLPASKWLKRMPDLAPQIEERKKKLKDFIDKSYKYYLRWVENKGTPPAEYNVKYDAMLSLWKDKLPVIIDVRKQDAIKEVLKLGKDYKLNLILYSAYDAEKLLKEIKDSGYPVILDSMFTENTDWEDGYDKVYRLPGLLAREGILFAFSSQASSNAYDIGVQAGRAVAFGLSQEDAVKGLTMNPAKILGIPEYGTIEEGKIANIIVASGNILETTTFIKDVFVKGKRNTAKSFYQKEFNRAKDRISGEY